MTCKYFSYIMAVSFIGGFLYRCFSFCTFSFGHCVVCSSIYGFWLSHLYLQTLLVPRGILFGNGGDHNT